MNKYLYILITILVLTSWLGSGVAFGAISVIQSRGNFQSAASTTTSVNITTSQGNALVCFQREGTASTTTWFITDSAGQASSSWKQATAGYNAPTGNSTRADMRYIENSQALTSVTVNWSQSVSNSEIRCLELGGMATSNMEDTSVTKTNANISVTTATSSPMTTSNANDILIFGVSVGANNGTSTWTTGTGYTFAPFATGTRIGVSYKIVSSTLSNTTTSISWGIAAAAAHIFASFKAADEAPTSTPAVISVSQTAGSMNINQGSFTIQ